MQTLPRRSLRSGTALLWMFLGLLGGVGCYAAGRPAAGGTLPRHGAAVRIPAAGRRTGNAVRPRGSDPSGFAWVQTTASAGSGTDVAQAVTFARDGSVVAAGYVANSPSEGTLFTVTKYSSNGSVLWSQTLGGPNIFAHARGVAVDSADNVIAVGDVAGLFTVAKWDAFGNLLWSFPDPQAQVQELGSASSVAVDRNDNIFVGGDVYTLDPMGLPGPDQFAVMRFQPNGTRAWEQLLGFSGAADSVAVDANNDVIAGGTTSFDSPQLFYVVKLGNGKGDVRWSQVVKGNSGEALSVAVDPQNNVLAAGYVDNATRDFTVTKLTPDTGDFVWLKELDSPSNSIDIAYAVASDSAGNAVVAGDLRDASGLDQFTVLKMAAADGSTVWSKFLQGNGTPTREDDNVARAVAVDGQGNVVAAGWLQNTNGHDFTATKLTAAGGTVWQRSIDGSLNGTDEAYAVAVDPNLNVAVAGMTENTNTLGDFTVAYGDEQAALLSNCSVTPTTFAPGGGTAALGVTAVDNFEIQSVFARIQRPDGSTVDVPLSAPPVVRFRPRSPNGNYSGSFVFPANTTGAPQVYPVSFYSIDSAGNQSPFVPCGSVTVNADTQPPVLSNPQANPAQLPQGGGSSTLSVNATDDQGVSTVIAVVTAPDGSQSTVTLVRNTTGDLTQYTGIFTAPAGPVGTPATYTLRFIATDTSGNAAAINGPNITVGTDTLAPTISNVQVTPRNLGADGGMVTVSADVTDNVGVGPVTATLTPPAGSPITVTLQQVTALRKPRVPGDGTYQGTLTVPANTAFSPLPYAVSVAAKDTSGNAATADGGSVTVAARIAPAPALTNLTVTPRNQPFTGGAVTISVDATDDAGIISVDATVTRPAGQTGLTVTLTRQGNSNTFTGSFNTTANLTQAPQIYAIQVLATNTQGATTNMDGGTVTVAAPAPIVLRNCAATPTHVTGAGGNVQVTVDVIAPAGVGRVFVTAVPTSKTGSVAVDLAPAGPGNNGVVSYTGTLPIPPNAVTSPLTYTLTITGTDLAGNSTTVDCGTVSQTAGGGGTIHVTPSSINFGNVRVGWGLRKKVVIQNTGVGTLSGAVSRPSGVFTIVGAEQPITSAKQPHVGPPSIPFVLEKGQKLVVTVQFAPVNHKPQQDTLVVTSSDPRNGRKTVKLRGVGCGTPAHGG